MSNPIIHGLEVAGKDALKVIEYPFARTAQFVAVVGTALKDEPEVKAAIVGLVKAAETVIADASEDVATKGIDIPEDLQTVTDVKAFFAYFSGTFLPAVEAAYKDIDADTK
jgi:hypothetical protein